MYPNETLRLLNERASVRNFKEMAIDPEKIEYLKKTICNTPSSGNLQSYSVIIIQKEESRKANAEWANQPFVAKAPIHFLLCIDLHRAQLIAEKGEAPFSAHKAFRQFWSSFHDVIIATQNLSTAADSLGLGSCYIGTIATYMKEIAQKYELPKLVLPVALLVVGEPASAPGLRKKFTSFVIVHEEKYCDYAQDDLYKEFEEKENHRTIPLTDETLETFSCVCTRVHGEEIANEWVTKIKEKGFFNPIQSTYGLLYRADIMPALNQVMFDAIQNQGFEWFS